MTFQGNEILMKSWPNYNPSWKPFEKQYGTETLSETVHVGDGVYCIQDTLYTDHIPIGEALPSKYVGDHGHHWTSSPHMWPHIAFHLRRQQTASHRRSQSGLRRHAQRTHTRVRISVFSGSTVHRHMSWFGHQSAICLGPVLRPGLVGDFRETGQLHTHIVIVAVPRRPGATQ